MNMVLYKKTLDWQLSQLWWKNIFRVSDDWDAEYRQRLLVANECFSPVTDCVGARQLWQLFAFEFCLWSTASLSCDNWSLSVSSPPNLFAAALTDCGSRAVDWNMIRSTVVLQIAHLPENFNASCLEAAAVVLWPNFVLSGCRPVQCPLVPWSSGRSTQGRSGRVPPSVMCITVILDTCRMHSLHLQSPNTVCKSHWSSCTCGLLASSQTRCQLEAVSPPEGPTWPS